MEEKVRRLKQKGGNLPKRKLGGPVMTQDSQKDPVPQQKTNDFLNWLRDSNMSALMEQQEEINNEFIPGFAQDGYLLQSTNIPEYRKNEQRSVPGVEMKDYGRKQDPNARAWMQSYYKDRPDWSGPISTLYSGATQAARAPDVWNLKIPKGQEQVDIFKDYQKEGYTDPKLTSFGITGVEKKGRGRTLHYKASGVQSPLEQEQQTQQSFEQPVKTVADPFEVPGLDITSPHAYMDTLEEMNKRMSPQTIPQKFMIPGITGAPTNVQLPSRQERGWLEKNKELLGMVGSYNKGGMVKAQAGMSYPGLDVYTGQGQPDISTTHGYMDFLQNIGNLQGQPTTIGQEELAQTTPEDLTIEQEGELEFQRQSRLKTAMERNPYLAPSAVLAGGKLLANIGGLDERATQEKAIRERVSNVHRLYGTQAADRGDYMVNVPGVGDPLKPDMRTRMGYDTKVAQYGIQVEDQLSLSEEQINKLIKEGYDVEYLD